MKLPSHLTLSIYHNSHKSSYCKMHDYIYVVHFERIQECLSEEEIKECIQKDEIWEIQWYPRTPIGFHYVCAATLEGCLDKIENGKWD